MILICRIIILIIGSENTYNHQWDDHYHNRNIQYFLPIKQSDELRRDLSIKISMKDYLSDVLNF